MSKQLKPPYSQEDIEWMQSRPTRFSKQLRELASGRLQVSEKSTPERAPENNSAVENNAGKNSDEEIEYVNGLNVEELKDELRERDLSTSGNKSELKARLLAVLADEE